MVSIPPEAVGMSYHENLEDTNKRASTKREVAQADEAEAKAAEARANVGFGSGKVSIFGTPIGGPGIDRKEYNKRYDTFSKDYVMPLNRLKKTDMEFNRILNSSKMTGAEKVTALLSAVGISGEPLQGKGFRINQAVISEHAGARNIWESAVQRANQLVGTGGPITEKQVRDYESIARGVVHDAYVAAGAESIRQGLNPDFLPKGNGKMPDQETARIYLDIAGGDRASAQKAMEPMPSRTAALPRSQGRNDCNRALAPASPSAPRNARGKQQDSVDSTAITAATGVARSATRMRIFTPSASPLKSQLATIPLAERRSDFHTTDTPSWVRSSDVVRHPHHSHGSWGNPETSTPLPRHRFLQLSTGFPPAKIRSTTPSRLARLRAGSSGSRGRTESQSSLTHPRCLFEHRAGMSYVTPTMVQFAVTLSQVRF
jgi:hypothetical protein